MSCVLLVTGLPPLPGFVAKFALLSTAIGAEHAAGPQARVGVRGRRARRGLRESRRADAGRDQTILDRHGAHDAAAARGRSGASCATRRVVASRSARRASPVMSYLQAAAASLHEPQSYIRAVLSSRPKPRAEATSREANREARSAATAAGADRHPRDHVVAAEPVARRRPDRARRRAGARARVGERAAAAAAPAPAPAARRVRLVG